MASYSNSYPTQTPENTWQLQLSQLIAQIGQQQVANAMGMYNKASQVSDAEINNFNQESASGMKNAQTFMNDYEQEIQPQIEAQIQDANTYSSTPRIQENMGAAESAAGQAGEQGRQNAEANLRSFGIDPSSGRYAELEQASRSQQAAAQAGAGQEAELATENTGRQLRQQAIATGQNLPGFAANALNSSINATSGAAQTGLGLANAGANLIQAPSSYFGDAMRINNPPSTQTSFNSGNDSSGNSRGSGGGGNYGGGGGGGDGGGGGGGGNYGGDSTGYTNDFGANADGGNFMPGGNGGDWAAGDGGGGDFSNSGGGADEGFASGGVIPGATTGGHVPVEASPSMGQNTDDVNARLNAGEFVIPRDVTAWKGQEFFQKLIEHSRSNRTGAPAKGKPKPALGGPPSFQSSQMGAQ